MFVCPADLMAQMIKDRLLQWIIFYQSARHKWNSAQVQNTDPAANFTAKLNNTEEYSMF